MPFVNKTPGVPLVAHNGMFLISLFLQPEIVKILEVGEPDSPYGLKEEDKGYINLIQTLSVERHFFQNELATLMQIKNITRNSELYNSVNMNCALFRKIMKAKKAMYLIKKQFLNCALDYI